MKMHQHFFPNSFEKTAVRWEKLKNIAPNSFICVTNEYSYRLLNIRKRLKSNNKINFKRLKTDK